jgi:hypothetical protein
VPENAEAFVVFGASTVQVLDRGVDAEVLVRPREVLEALSR